MWSGSLGLSRTRIRKSSWRRMPRANSSAIQIVPSRRGRGLGVTLIRAGTLRYLEEIPAVNVVHAFIKKTNQASIAAFSKAGYQHSRDLVTAGHKSCDMVFQRDSEQ